MRKIALLALLAGFFVTPAYADFTGKDAAAATITFKNPNACTSVVCTPIFSLYDPTGTNGTAVDTAGADAVSNAKNGLAVYSRNIVWNGTTWDRWMGDLTNGAWVNVKSSVLPALAATSTKQSDGSQKTQVVDGSGNIQPSGDTVARAIFEKITDGANTAAVKAASTAPLATDPAIVAALSPNGNQSTAANQTSGGQKSQQVDASGNVQPSGDTVARAVFEKITDGTNTAGVAPASTPPAATVPALVIIHRADDPLLTTASTCLAGTTPSSSTPATSGAVTGIQCDLNGNVYTKLVSQYPAGAVPISASATGTTAATTATLAGAASKTTYICSLSIRSNATAAATGNATVTGTITGTMNYTHWTAPLASGIGLTEMIFNPCVPASATNTGIAVISPAPGSGGVVSSTATGYQL